MIHARKAWPDNGARCLGFLKSSVDAGGISRVVTLMPPFQVEIHDPVTHSRGLATVYRPRCTIFVARFYLGRINRHLNLIVLREYTFNNLLFNNLLDKLQSQG
jgi:hypothetical protein